MSKRLKRITLAHGNGGRLMHELVDSLRLEFSNRILNETTDAAELHIDASRLSFSTDSYVIKPLFFPGGDIGKLAVYGTVNDISMKGAVPLFLSLSFIIEEGLEYGIFEKIVSSIKQAAHTSKVTIVTGDIKIVEKGAADKLFINTSGIGVITKKGVHIGSRAKKGDVVIINGPIAEHGVAVFNARHDMGFSSAIRSDCRNVNFQIQDCLKVTNKISVLRDPTRGGLATTLNEIAHASNLGIEVYENKIPIRPDVRKLCDILGFDPLYIANEGKFICFVNKKDSARVLKVLGTQARMIGEVRPSFKKEVYLKTGLGALRILPMLEVDQLPRIC